MSTTSGNPGSSALAHVKAQLLQFASPACRVVGVNAKTLSKNFFSLTRPLTSRQSANCRNSLSQLPSRIRTSRMSGRFPQIRMSDPFEDFCEAEGLDSNKDALPYSTRTERGVIGVVVNDPACLCACRQKGISKDHFHEMQAQLWEEIVLAESDDRSFDRVSLADHLTTTGNGSCERLCARLEECALEGRDPGKIDGYCETLIDTKARRDAIVLGDILIKLARAGSPQWRAELQKIQEIGNDILPDGLPPMISAQDLCANPPPTPPQVIEGVLHQGSKLVLGGGSKSFKTWALLHLASCIPTGLPWLGFETFESPVLYVNFELPAFNMESRIRAICAALNVPIPKNLTVWNLRGHATDAGVILPKITRAIKKMGYSAVFLDPIYKLLGEREENSARDMTNLMNSIEQLSEYTRAAVLFGSHFAKGNASAKESMDRISGSGVIARDPDSIITLTKHEEDKCFAVEFTLRNFPPQEPFVVRHEHPLMVVTHDLDPEKLKKPTRPGRPQEYSLDDVFAQLKRLHVLRRLGKKCKKNLDMSGSTFRRYRDDLKRQGRVFLSDLDGLWCPR